MCSSASTVRRIQNVPLRWTGRFLDVDSTVRDAMFRDYLAVLLADCMSEPLGNGLPRSNHDASLLSVEVLLGWVSDSERFLKAVLQ